MAQKYLSKWRPGFIESQNAAAAGGSLPAANVPVTT